MSWIKINSGEYRQVLAEEIKNICVYHVIMEGRELVYRVCIEEDNIFSRLRSANESILWTFGNANTAEKVCRRLWESITEWSYPDSLFELTNEERADIWLETLRGEEG